MGKPREPGEGDCDRPAIHKVHHQSIIINVYALCDGFSQFSFGNTHAKPSKAKPTAPSPFSLSVGSPRGETHGSLPRVPGPAKTLLHTFPAQRARAAVRLRPPNRKRTGKVRTKGRSATPSVYTVHARIFHQGKNGKMGTVTSLRSSSRTC